MTLIQHVAAEYVGHWIVLQKGRQLAVALISAAVSAPIECDNSAHHLAMHLLLPRSDPPSHLFLFLSGSFQKQNQHVFVSSQTI